MTLPRLALAMAILLGLAVPARADFDSGFSAYMRGDYAAALREFRFLASQGHAEAQYTLGYMHANGLGLPKRPALAAKWYRLAAQQGHIKAQVNLGTLYHFGQGVRRNDAEALLWYRRAAEGGSAKAQYMLGVMYQNGYGVKRSYVRAHMWYDLAAAQNLSIAGEVRKTIAKRMSYAQLAKAEKLAAEWRKRHRKPGQAQ